MSKCQIITTSYNILNPTQPCFCTLIPLVLKTLGDQPNFASPRQDHNCRYYSSNFEHPMDYMNIFEIFYVYHRYYHQVDLDLQ
jgi:hypothetical protein